MHKTVIIRKATALLWLFALTFVLFTACAAGPSAGQKAAETAVAEPAAAPAPADKNRLDLKYDPKHLIFLLIGQSNMEGLPGPDRAEDVAVDPRIHVLAYNNSQAKRRQYNKWYPAKPPLHSDYLGIGPGDYFGKTLIAMLPEGYTIGLVPCGIAGVDIDFFRKNVVSKRRNEFFIPPDNQASGAYEWVLERARLAAETGTIAGILFHQGESDSGQRVWLDKVSEMVADLRTDLGIPDLPFLAGELYYKGACAGHNSLVRKLSGLISNCHVISAKGLNGVDQFHFDLEGQRELGKRYAETMYGLLNLDTENE